MSLHRPSKNARLMTAHSSAAILRLSLLSAQTSDLQSGIPTAAQRPWQAAPSVCMVGGPDTPRVDDSKAGTLLPA